MNASDLSPRSIPMSQTTQVMCKCGHGYFKQVLTIRKVSALLSGTGREEIGFQPVVVCDKCGEEYKNSQLVTA